MESLSPQKVKGREEKHLLFKLMALLIDAEMQHQLSLVAPEFAESPPHSKKVLNKYTPLPPSSPWALTGPFGNTSHIMLKCESNLFTSVYSATTKARTKLQENNTHYIWATFICLRLMFVIIVAPCHTIG